MRIIFQLFIFLSDVTIVFGSTGPDSQDFKKEINELKEEVERVKRDQLNYRIEKDLIKETYSANYERINIVITIVLGIIGILGYIGIRDISSIKKEYAVELDKIRNLQNEFKAKSNEFDSQKATYDNEIKKLIEVNEDQNKKLKLLEIKEKVFKILDEEKISTEVLQYITIGLEIDPKDMNLHNAKCRACIRLNQLDEAITALENGRALYPKEPSFITNLVEAYFINNQIEKAREILKENMQLFIEKDDKRVLDLFDVIEAYHKNDETVLRATIEKTIILGTIDVTPDKLKSWNLTEVKFFLVHQLNDNRRKFFVNYIRHLEGLISGTELKKLLT